MLHKYRWDNERLVTHFTTRYSMHESTAKVFVKGMESVHFRHWLLQFGALDRYSYFVADNIRTYQVPTHDRIPTLRSLSF